MFAQARRLQRSQDILAVFRNGERFRRGSLTLFYLKGEISRATVVVDKKVSKLATTRNRLKRQLRAILLQETLPAGDLVLRAFPGAEKQSFAELKSTVQACLKTLTTPSKR